MRKIVYVAGIVLLALASVLLLAVGAQRFWFGSVGDNLDRQRAAEAATLQSLSRELQGRDQRIDLTRSPAPDTESGSYAKEPGTSGHRSGH